MVFTIKVWSRETQAVAGVTDDGRSGGGGVCPPWVCEDTLKVIHSFLVL